jgi:hypothetical protein
MRLMTTMDSCRFGDIEVWQPTIEGRHHVKP